MKLISAILFTVIFNVYSTFGQTYPQVVVIEKDSCIIFTLPQSRQMIKWDLQLSECRTNLKLTLNESALKDSIILNQSNQITQYQQIEATYGLIDKENKELRKLLEEERAVLTKEIRRQKFRKFLVGIGGFCTTAVATFLYIRK